jgi:hypothetical protein
VKGRAPRGKREIPKGICCTSFRPALQNSVDTLLIVTSEAGVSAPLSKAFSISLVVQDTYKTSRHREN